MIRDDALPVGPDTLNEARRTLNPEFGFKTVNERGRNVLLVRVPRARPDYLHDLEGAAQTVDLDTLGSVKDVLLVGDEKVTRMDPLPLRDQVKNRRAEDTELVQGLLKRLQAPYEVTTFKHQGAKSTSTRLAVRIPRPSISAITPEDIEHIKSVAIPALEASGGEAVSVAYVIADADFERLPRVTFNEILGIAPPPPPPAPVAPAMAPAPAGYAYAPASVPVAESPGVGYPAAAAAPAAAPAPAPKKQDVEVTAINDDTEIYVAKKPAPKPAAGGKAPADTRPVRQQVEEDPEAKILKASDEFVVYTSNKPKPATPDPEYQKPFLLSDLKSLGQPKGKAGKDYEIMGGGSSPYAAGGISPLKAAAAAKSPLMAAAQAAQPQPQMPPAGAYVPPTSPTAYAPGAGLGMPQGPAVIPTAPVAPASPFPAPAPTPAATPFVDPVGALAAVFQGNQYETMRDLQVAGATYALAAHRAGGKRVLVRNVEKWDESQQAAALQGADTLGADVLLVVAKEISPGARLAAWGTKLQVLTAAEAVGLKL